MISIVIPVLNDYHALSDLLVPLAQLQSQCDDIEIIIADGGSVDGSVMLAKQFADEFVQTTKGRAIQQNAGAKLARGEVLWFIHADTQLDFANFSAYLDQIKRAHLWGRFNVKIQGTHFMLPLIAKMMNFRSCLSGIATGDQGLFIKKDLFDRVGGFPYQALMEDIELSKRLKKISKYSCIDSPKIITFGRKWQQEGVFYTIFKMWAIRIQYFFGVSAKKLEKQYYR